MYEEFPHVIDQLAEDEGGAKSSKEVMRALGVPMKEAVGVGRKLQFLDITGKISKKKVKPTGILLYWRNKKTRGLLEVLTENPLMNEILRTTPIGAENAKRVIDIADVSGFAPQTTNFYLRALISFGVVKMFTKTLHRGLSEKTYFHRIKGDSFQPTELKKTRDISKNDVLLVLSQHPNTWLKPREVAKNLKVGTTTEIRRVSALLFRLRNDWNIERVKHSRAYQYRCIGKHSVHFERVNDSIRAFITECLILKPSEKYPQPTLWRDYVDYCDMLNLQIQQKSVFTNRIGDLRSVALRRAKVDGKSQNTWHGLTFKGDKKGKNLEENKHKMVVDKFAELGYQLTPTATELLLPHIPLLFGEIDCGRILRHIGSGTRTNNFVILPEDIENFLQQEKKEKQKLEKLCPNEDMFTDNPPLLYARKVLMSNPNQWMGEEEIRDEMVKMLGKELDMDAMPFYLVPLTQCQDIKVSNVQGAYGYCFSPTPNKNQSKEVKDTSDRLKTIDDRLTRVDELHKVNEELREALVRGGERESALREMVDNADKDHAEVEQLKKELVGKSNEITKLKEERMDHFSIQAEERIKRDVTESRKLLEGTFKG